MKETIAAIATPPGEGGIGVVRLSGTDAVEICDFLFEGKKRVKDIASHTVSFGNFVHAKNRKVIDEVVVTLFRKPNSYTGEDLIEISCHGGILVTKLVLKELLEAGARLADPGEFTKRSFLNGKIDLSQAEAVADLISAKADKAYHLSLEQLKGGLSKEIESIRSELLNSCSLIELELDFAEEDLEFVNSDQLLKYMVKITTRLNVLINSFNYGKIYREGIKVVLAGKPNSGKSSLLNSLLKENRAIVTEIPGTTRDIIEENLTIDGILFKIVDTAGLRDTQDPVESEGVARTINQLERADMVLLLIDFSEDLTENELKYFNNILKKMKKRKIKSLILFNKIDIARGKEFPQSGDLLHYPFAKISAKTGEGMETLKTLMVKNAANGLNQPEGGLMITNVRHRDALVRAKKSLEMAANSLNERKSGEFVAVDLRAALDSLGEITGVVTTDDILNNIFSKFCIGK